MLMAKTRCNWGESLNSNNYFKAVKGVRSSAFKRLINIILWQLIHNWPKAITRVNIIAGLLGNRAF